MDKFYKSDLHLHSPSCYSRSYSKSDFINKLNETDLEVISLTDHNIIDTKMYNDVIVGTKKKLILGIEMNVSLSNDTILRHNLIVSEIEYFHSILWFDINNIIEIQSCLKKLQQKLLTKDDFTEPIDYKEISKKLKGKYFELEDIQKEFINFPYFFVPHEGKGDRNLSDYLRNIHEPNQYYKQKLFYYNNNYGIEGKKNDTILDFFDKNLNTLIPNFYFSDAKILSEIGSTFTWLNFDGTFSSLILPFSDPKTRVFKSIDVILHPQKNKNDYLDSIKFDIGENPYELSFNPGINGIIGPRGSGKSLLANIITSNLENYGSMNIDKIQYKMKDSEYLNVVPKYQYINQGYLAKIFDERDFRKIKYIDEIRERLINIKKESINQDIKNVENCFENIQNELESFLKDNFNEYSFDDIKNRKEDTLLIHGLDILNGKDDNSVRNSILISLKSLLKAVEKVKKDTEEISLNFVYSETQPIKADTSNKIKVFTNKVSENIEILNNLIIDFENSRLIKKIELRKTNLSNYKRLVNLENGEINNSVRISLENYDDFFKFLKSLNLMRRNIFKYELKAKNLFESIFSKIEKKSFELSKGEMIEITTNLEQHEKFEDLIENYIRTNGKSLSDILVNMILGNFEDYYYKNKIRNIGNLNDLLEKFFEKIINDVKKHEKIDIDILVDGIDIQQMSPGKQSEILLRIIMEKEINDDREIKYIVFDQPEDNLDTQTIVNFLVEKLRDLKLEKQVFIVSHSAPLIVNSDSDIVISCTNIDRVSYETGNINNANIRSSIVDVLDGGEKYLKMRVNKYDFNYKEI